MTTIRTTFACSVCGAEAGVVLIRHDGDAHEARRESWPGVLILPRTAAELAPLRAALEARDVQQVFAFHFELAGAVPGGARTHARGLAARRLVADRPVFAE